jgi:hypothetical protein
MPQWRKLHIKTLDSLDLAEAPDDFTRLMWLMLPLILDSAGRALDDAAWLRSKLFPLRRDVTIEQIEQAMAYFADRCMVERYTVKGRRYFWAPNFCKYQGSTEREAPSAIPEPVMQADLEPAAPLMTNSGPAHEPVVTGSLLEERRGEAEAEEKRGEIGADAPAASPEPPAEELAKGEPETPLSKGQRDFLAAFGAKRFKTHVQRDAVLALEKTYGTKRLEECITWAAKRGMGLGEAVTAIESAIATWGQRKSNGARSAAPVPPAARPAVSPDEEARIRAALKAAKGSNGNH